MQLAKPVSVSSLRFLDEYQFPGKQVLDTSVIGGLSGIDYDAKKNIYYLICDDPSAYGPARFYTAEIRIDDVKIDTMVFTSMVPLLDARGQRYPDIRKDRVHSADVEAMRYNPRTRQLIRSTEGQRAQGPMKTQFQQPEVVIMDIQGRFRDTFRLPANFRIDSMEKGPRHNSVFEGLTFRNDYREILVAVEDALYDDGPRAATGDSSAWSRIAAFDLKSRKQVAQYAYPLSPVPKVPVPASAFKVNGVTDLLWIGSSNYLVIERAWSTGTMTCQVKLWLADFSNATDVSGIASLSSQRPLGPEEQETSFRPIRKKLLLDFDTLGRDIYNIEGMTLGPKLSNGRQSIFFVVDDNFNDRERNQLLMFEIVP